MTPVILVVDADRRARESYRRDLSDFGCDVLSCEDGATVLACIDRERPDMVILDMHLGDMPGTKILRRIKTAQPALPVYLCADCNCFFYDARAALADGRFFKSSQWPLLMNEIHLRVTGMLAPTELVPAGLVHDREQRLTLHEPPQVLAVQQ